MRNTVLPKDGPTSFQKGARPRSMLRFSLFPGKRKRNQRRDDNNNGVLRKRISPTGPTHSRTELWMSHTEQVQRRSLSQTEGQSKHSSSVRPTSPPRLPKSPFWPFSLERDPSAYRSCIMYGITQWSYLTHDRTVVSHLWACSYTKMKSQSKREVAPPTTTPNRDFLVCMCHRFQVRTCLTWFGERVS